jgi:alanine transaminase
LQVLSIVENPDLLKIQNVSTVFPSDVIARAKSLIDSTAPSAGAYTNSKGLAFVRQHVCDFIKERDGGHSANPEHIFLSDGASPAVKVGLTMLLRGRNDGILLPIPQYPLYSATIALLGGTQVPYYLDEANQWGLSVTELEQQYAKARKSGIDVRAVVVINPGNPTGQVMTYDNIAEVVQWAGKRDVLVLADEVYQANVYEEGKQFHSFKKVVRDLKSNVQCLSFHSVSKGVIGECGKRGGYMEAVNIDDALIEQIYKLNSINLCPNVPGQLTVDVMVKPPAPGDASYERHTPRCEIYDSLKRRAERLAKMLNSLEGVTCNPAQGAMYAFPQVRLPAKAIEAAKLAKQVPDAYYCMQLLENTGICVVPGSGFGQRDGTFHFRTTFLPREDKVEDVARLMKEFHAKFMAKHK